ncbi:hypothetical protein E0485_08605 [Paenibacillus albiflavus]|uniref:Uncharacterized protein n=1 Tax=Paenibacillus albiflavus TaxID=2545760 RepID=A0A4R4EDV7_9BACL|nr:hypothetical protein [Paenibacillus albiflavus]TCZ78176.1 hypothetical protein E0485_08605 [Paenibacillus albiflavus]
MTNSQFVRSFAMLGIIGFVVTVASVIINIVTDSTSLVGNYLNMFGLIFVVFGVMAAYLSQKEDLGVFGFVSFVIVLIGFIWSISIVAVHSFAFSVINDLGPSMKINELISTEMPSPIKEALITSSIVGAVGSLLFGLVISFKGTIMRWPGLLLILAAVGSALEFVDQLFSFLGFILSLIAVLWMSIKVWTQGIRLKQS